MPSLSTLVALAALPAVASASPLFNLVKRAQLALDFVAPSSSPLNQSSNYVGKANATLPKLATVQGKAFDRFIQIWLENTDADTAMATPAFQQFAKEGITLNQRYGVTHPSEPNYVASAAGDFFGMASDNFYYIPENITTLWDTLDDGGASKKAVSYACYQENMPANGYTGFNWTDHNYLTNNGSYVFYVRKHNPCAITNYVSANATRAEMTNRNFNQFAADLQADTLPQYMFITPNLVNDAHDTTPSFFSNWTEYFLTPLLNDTRFNNNRTLIEITFDENESYGDPNRIASLLLGGVIPTSSQNTTDDTYLTHYSIISTIRENWSLKNLGRGDVNTTLSNVYGVVAPALNYNNVQVDPSTYQLNLTGVAPGPFSETLFSNFTYPPNADNNTLIKAGLANMTQAEAFSNTQNLTAMGSKNPYSTNPLPSFVSTSSSNSTSSSSGSGSGSNSAASAAGVAGKAVAAIAAIAAGVALL